MMTNFIDTTGHIFSLQSYMTYPIGYEYETMPYIFWFNSEYSNKLSIESYYVMPIRIIIDSDKIVKNINVKISSDIYKMGLIDRDNIEINEKDLLSEISIDNFNILKGIESNDGKKFNVYTFYIFANAKEEGSWFTNPLISILYEDGSTEYCPITISGAFVDDIEELQINASNIGVRLPKDIIKAVWGSNYFDDIIDDNLYNIKMKEYLINNMLLKEECGNYNSAIGGLKWFGWGKELEISKLLQTDNEFCEQFVHDYFNIEGDILESFKLFKNTTYISLHIDENSETGKIFKVDSDKPLWGEGKPEYENLFDKKLTVYIDDVDFIKDYYRYNFNEMALKLSCLSYMYKKYFLPIHLSIHSASIRHQVHANDNKLLTVPNVSITETPLVISDKNTIVTFDNNRIYYLYNFGDIMDDNCNKFNNYTIEYCENDNAIHYKTIDTITAKIPIYFNGTNTIFDCVLVLSRDDKKIYETKFLFNKEKQDYEYFFLVPKLITEIIGTDNNKDFWEGHTFRIDILCNGDWYSHEFKLDVPEMQIDFGKLIYNYDKKNDKQINYIDEENNYIDFNVGMYQPDVVTKNSVSDIYNLKYIIDTYYKGGSFSNKSYNWSFDISNIKDPGTLNGLIKSEYINISNKPKYYNRIVVYNLFDNNEKNIRYRDVRFGKYTDKFTFKDETIKLYKNFFSNTGKQKTTGISGYDMYLMHDNIYYYVVFISKDTIDNIENINEPDKILFGDYMLIKEKASDIFLINRMLYKDIVHFDIDDIIVARCFSKNYPYISELGSKWEFDKISLKGDTIDPVYSDTMAAIFSIPDNYIKYVPGYYNVTVRYTIDEYWDNCRSVKGKIRINNNYTEQ